MHLRRALTCTTATLIVLLCGSSLMNARVTVGRGSDDTLTVAQNNDGTLTVARFYADTVFFRTQDVPNGDWPSAETPIYSPTGSYFFKVSAGPPNVSSNGAISLFSVDSIGNAFVARRNPDLSFGFYTLGRFHHIAEIDVGQNQDGRLEAFPVDAYGTLLHIWQTSPVTGAWVPDWQTLGNGPSGYHMRSLAVGQNQDGRLEVFGADSYGTLLHAWQTSPGGNWSDWQTLGSGHSMGGVRVGQNQDGRLEVFGIDSYGTLLHLWQNSPGGCWSSGGCWSDWQILGSGPSGHHMISLAVGQNQDGRLEVFGDDSYGIFLHVSQNVPNGYWGAWQTLGGGGVLPLAVGQDSDGSLEVLGFQGSPTLYHIWQAVPSGGPWSTFQTLDSSAPFHGYAYCSLEGGNCNFTGTAKVGYGANGKFVFQELTNGTACNNSVFGDPAPGVVKSCFIPGGPLGNTFCAMEGGFCSFSGTRLVTYISANGYQTNRLYTNGTACDNAAFEDVEPYVQKACLVYSAPFRGCVYCSLEGGNCNFTGTAKVGYGANGNFVFQEPTNGTACNNSVFGDPAPGVPKSCYIPGGPMGSTFCAMEGSFCSFSGTRLVTYISANGDSTNRFLTNGTACDNAVFGDPEPYVQKACFVQ